VFVIVPRVKKKGSTVQFLSAVLGSACGHFARVNVIIHIFLDGDLHST